MNPIHSERMLKVFGDISEQYILEAVPGTVEADGRDKGFWKGRQTVRTVRRSVAIAACLCLAASGVVWGLGRRQVPPGTLDSGNGTPALTVTEAGVYIPPMAFDLSTEGQAYDMIGFFIYQGRWYTQYETLYAAGNLVGQYLGTAVGSIDEWTPAEGYVELAGSVRGDFYTVQGFDPDFMLCIPRTDGRVETYINDNGITLHTGADLFEDRLRLSENYRCLEYEAQDAWYHDRDEIFALDAAYGATVWAFLDALDRAEFQPVYTPDGIPAAMPGNTLYHLALPYANGITVRLRLADGGYVSFDGISRVCLRVEDGSFEALLALLGQPDAGTPTAREQQELSYDDCRAEPVLGRWLPEILPAEAIFVRGDIHYGLIRETGQLGMVQEVRAEFDYGDIRSYFSLTVFRADAYGTNGWAGPVYEAASLTLEDVAACIRTESANGRPLGRPKCDISVRTGDAIMLLSATGLDAATVLELLRAVPLE